MGGITLPNTPSWRACCKFCHGMCCPFRFHWKSRST